MGIFNLFGKTEIKKEYHENGKLKCEYEYKSGKKHGYEKGFHENGSLRYETQWVNGKQNGEVSSFDEQGNKIKQSFLKMGRYEGPQKEWWTNGNLKADRVMKNDEVFSEITYSPNGSVVVFEDKLEDKGIVSYHNGKPFTGIMFSETTPSPTGFPIKVNIETEMVDGLKDGIRTDFYDNGKIKLQTKFSKDKFVNILGYFDYEGNNILEAKTCVFYTMLEEKDNIFSFKKKPFNGVSYSQYGSWTAFYKDGVQISSKHYFADGSVKSITENIDGNKIELKGWIKIDDEGNYDENGKKILVREYKDGKKIAYYENGNKKSEDDVNRKKSKKDSSNSYTEIRYFKNGNLNTKEVKTKFDSDGNNGGVTIEYSEFYETGELKKEKVSDKKYETKYVSYHKNKTIKSIVVSESRWTHEGHTFEFDEKGNEISTIDPNSEKEQEARKYLKLKTASKEEIISANKKEIDRLNREINVNIDDIDFKTTVGEFEKAGPEYAIRDEDGYEVIKLDDNSNEYTLYTSDSPDEVAAFFMNFTKKEIVVTAEHNGYDEELGDIYITEVAFINCECPEEEKKYYNGELFIEYNGKLLETNSDDYKKINFDEIWDEAEIRNSGVECILYSEYLKHLNADK